MNMITYLGRLAVASVAFSLGISSHYSLESIKRHLRNVVAGQSAPMVPTVESPQLPILNVIKDVDGAETAGADYGSEFNLSGIYYMSGEILPKGFEDFQYLDIETHKYDPMADLKKTVNPWEPIPPRGTFQTKRVFKLRTISISPVHISFETEKKSGISYRFVGQLGGSSEASEGHISPDIFGKLLKLKNGNVIATIEAEFYVGGC